MVKNMADLMKIADEYALYLEGKGIVFNESGFPVLPKESFLDEWPEDVFPYDHRKSSLVGDPKKTLLCFYCGDSRIYPRLERIFRNLPEYRKYLGVVAVDLTVTSDMDEEWQDFVMLIQQLFIAVLATNGVKVVANLRIGGEQSLRNLESLPKGIMWCTGFLGCAAEDDKDCRFLASVLKVWPGKLIIYGRSDKSALEKLRRFGITFRRYDDYHCRCKNAQEALHEKHI